jgi:hypothetical protein
MLNACYLMPEAKPVELKMDSWKKVLVIGV